LSIQNTRVKGENFEFRDKLINYYNIFNNITQLKFESVAKVKTILQLDNRNVDFIYDYKFFA